MESLIQTMAQVQLVSLRSEWLQTNLYPVAVEGKLVPVVHAVVAVAAVVAAVLVHHVVEVEAVQEPSSGVSTRMSRGKKILRMMMTVLLT